MSETALAIVQEFTDKLGLPRPSGLIGSTEKSHRQLRALLNETVANLAEYAWEAQTLRFTWTSVAGADQGALTSIFGAGYDALIPDTLWNETRHMRIYGPVPAAVWQTLQTLPNGGPEYQCWVSGGHLLVSPNLVAGETLSAVYRTKYVVLAVDGVTTKPKFTADDDTFLFPDLVVSLGLEWRWRKQKGEAGWEDDYNAYLALIGRGLAKNLKPTLHLDSSGRTVAKPGIVIPAGSWNV